MRNDANDDVNDSNDEKKSLQKCFLVNKLFYLNIKFTENNPE